MQLCRNAKLGVAFSPQWVIPPPRLTLPDFSAYSPFRDHTLFIFVGTRRVNGFAVALEIDRFAVAPGLSRTGSGSWPGEILVNA